jgi:ADP-ribose pyrophosphatase YjhB (NUDIX family)
MVYLGVTMAVLKDGKVLLTRREDFEVWCLPGGAVDANETLPQAAVREVREETGLDVEITALVGIYSMPDGPSGGSHVVCFSGRAVGGELCPARAEVLEAGFFGREDLPAADELFLDSQCQILDALEGVGGSAVWQTVNAWPFPHEFDRGELYRLRDQSGLPRGDFYRAALSQKKVINKRNV